MPVERARPALFSAPSRKTSGASGAPKPSNRMACNQRLLVCDYTTPPRCACIR